jgi:hypothetical protein
VDIGLGAAAFWISVAAVLIAGGYFSSRKEALKQETLLRLVERTGQLDEQQVKALFPPPHPLPPHWFAKHETNNRLALQVLGTIVLFIAAGLAIFFTITSQFGQPEAQAEAVYGFAATSIVACIGLGLLAASRLIPRRPERPADKEAA